ncbi:uncharacterized protein RCC_07809 [Ramularia collo-cygni]|uniref:Uncharacterized protein n=1 Tax=Ramularia collo-cygni TaxID=112498 RepID=A0A2D3UVZ3_9PEZI|nr:uncharacterized protein RCC_07809 [Ramularia collo-cygni]CZT21942.1 uncharacterized protein RCC_07809 [Ramularia collo-cygni]
MATSRTSGITSYFQPTQSTKRKAEDNGPEKENFPNAARKRAKGQTNDEASTAESDDAQVPKKTAKARGKPPGRAKAIKPKAGPTPKKLFNDTVKQVAKQVKALDKKIKSMNGNTREVYIADYADIAAQHIPVVERLAAVDSALAFNLALCLGDAASTDLNVTIKMSGYGDHESSFAELDAALLPLIEAREVPTTRLEVLPAVAHRWTRADADVGEFKTGRPNKQQRNEMANDRIDWEHERRAERMKRRMECEDWVTVALADLKGERDYLDAYGVEGFFEKSIAKLEAIDLTRK